jgi:hypothetical protein
MTTHPTRATLFEEHALELAHFSAAPAAFFRAWKSGVSLAGVRFFGAGTKIHLDRAVDVWDLCPNLELITDAIGVMSGGEKVFLAALVSFYNAEDGGRLLRRVSVHGLADLGGLDLARRTVIAALILNYTGW